VEVFRVTTVHDQRDHDEGRRLIRRRQDLVLSSAPSLNAANDNEQTLHFAASPEGSDSVTSVQSQSRSSFGTIVLIIASLATASMMTMGWIYIISMTLLDGLKWVLR
jgi:hypothetical protein